VHKIGECQPTRLIAEVTNMKDNEFEHKIKFLEQQVHELQKHATKNPVRLRKVLSEALEELHDSLEELKVAEEELYQQNEELIESSRTVELEKQRYQELFDFAPNGYLATDPEGVIKEANFAAASMFQLRQGLLVGKSLVVYVAAEDRKAFRDQLSRLRRLEKMQDWEVKLQPFKGEPFPGAITVAIMRNTEGRIIGLRWLIRDITEHKKLEEDRLRLSKLESIGVLAGGIAHDFNNMLAGIMTTMSLAKMDPNIRMETYEGLTEAERVCLQAKRLTQQLLTFSRGGTPVKELVSITEFIKDTATFALRGSSVRCDISIEDDLWNVRIDEGQISQVIGNIVINAAQAMPQGGVISIRAENINYEMDNLPLRNGMYVKIKIEDEGIGIPEEHLSRIFDPYFTTKQKGSGLGLATAYSIIKSHGGFIDVESELGKGSRFYIYIPASEKRVLQRKSEREKRAEARSRARVLIMDDEAIIRKSVGRALMRMGYDVEYATDGQEAIEIYTKAREENRVFDLVIMDLTVPGGMGGKEAIKRLKDIDPDVRAVVSSGYSNDPVMSEFTNYGFRGVISKPYTIEDLAETLYKVINEQ